MKILVIGLGGIGSYLVREISESVQQGQIDANVDISDGDIVEVKNTEFQNFRGKDVAEQKSSVIQERYGEWLGGEEKAKITDKKQLFGYDLIICCADNFKVRELVFRTCYKLGTDFIDLRSEGRFIVAFQKSGNLDDDLETLDLKDKESGSCQRKGDAKKRIIQKGYKIASAIGIQMVLNYLRKEHNPKILIRV